MKDEKKNYKPAYTIEDIQTFSPIGEWQLVSMSDHSVVLANMYNASFVFHTVLLTHTGLTDEPTFLIAQAG